MIRLTIDNKEITTPKGFTILEAAKNTGIIIPTLCYHERLNPIGSCRLCVVEVDGQSEPVTACTTPVEDGMSVATQSDRLFHMRQDALKLILANHPLDCPVCDKAGACMLQDLTVEYGIKSIDCQVPKRKFTSAYHTSFIKHWPERCILCQRCVNACKEIQNIGALDIENTEDGPQLSFNRDKCVSCGECVQVCPVGGMLENKSSFRWRSWETTRIRTTCPYCGVGCQQLLHVKNGKIVQVTGVDDAEPNKGSLCVKGRYGFDFIHSPERLTTPLIKVNGKFRPASWDEALSLVADRLGEIKTTHGPDSIGVLSSARITNEENYIANKFTRAVLKTNNIDHCARLCHASTVAGLAASFGSGAMTNPIGDFEKADVILITGSNTTETHPVLSTFIKRTAMKKTAKLIVVDPRRISMTGFADMWLRQNLGTDVAWINGMMHVIIEEGLYDKAFVENRTVGFDELKQVVEKYTPEFVEAITGIPTQDLIDAARLYAGAKAGSILYCMGITQHSTGTDNVKSLANLAMLCGNLGIEGGGVNPLRGQNNVQGACDMGALPNVYSGYQSVTDAAARSRMEKAWGVSGLPDKIGLKATEMIPKAHSGELKALYIIGENPLVSDPDLNHAEKSIANLDFLVVQDIFMTETAKQADVVLPSRCFAEKDGTFTNTERKVLRVRKAVDPPGEAWDDWKITCEIATRMGHAMSYENSRAIMEEISRVTPSYAGISYSRIENDGIHWPCPDATHPGTPILHKDKFPIGKGVFFGIEYIPPAEQTTEDYPLYLTTGRVLYQYHTGTMTMKTEGLNERAPECFVEISSNDAGKIGLSEGNKVDIASRRGIITTVIKVSEMAVDGTVFIPFHFAQAAANRLTNAALDPIAKIPEYKVCAVRLSKAA
ncbi:MAG: formate dehydrogenase subunit alpha [Deltaproteobacteria bacterium]|nr:formate dehydrogenase subunit alpha [Deltaproteobacteria bacterium]